MRNPIDFPFRYLLSLLFFCLISSLFTRTTSKILKSLDRGSSLSVEDDSALITSPDNSFTGGFHEVGNNDYGFGIWFTHSRERTIVWMANRDKPVNRRGSKKSFRRDGSMVLTDVDGSIAWETNTSSTDVRIAELLNSGNLVLKDPHAKLLHKQHLLRRCTRLLLRRVTPSFASWMTKR